MTVYDQRPYGDPLPQNRPHRKPQKQEHSSTVPSCDPAGNHKGQRMEPPKGYAGDGFWVITGLATQASHNG